MSRKTATLTAVALLLAGGLAHGLWSERWAPSAAVHDAAARVALVPTEIAGWKATVVDTDSTAFFRAGALQYWARTYVDERRKTPVLVILMCGRAGRMAVHTPEVCYRGAGYDLAGSAQTFAAKSAGGDKLGDFWTARFTKQSDAKLASGGADLRLYWAWNAHDTWQAPANPRWEFRSEPFLYKLYVSCDVTGSTDDAAQEFLGVFLPELRKTLFPSEGIRH